MKRITNRKFRLGFLGKLYDKNGKEIAKVRGQMKKRILDFIEANPPKEGHLYIKVNYGNDFTNESDHTSQAEAIKALNSYTEKQMLDYISE